MKSPVEPELLDALAELDKSFKAVPAIEAKPSLLLLFNRIDELAGQLPPGADSELRHYLQRKSYEKARLLLQARKEENMPGCCR
jgi:hypothetical protein